MKRLEAQLVQRQRGADNVNDRIGGANFVKVYLIEGNAMNLGFDLGEARENS